MAEPTLERLRELLTRDHRHGCPGHACSCNYNKEMRDALIAAFNVLRKQTPAAAELLRLQEQLEKARAVLRCLRISESENFMHLVIILPNGDSAGLGAYGPESIAANVLCSLRALSSAAEGGEK